MGKTYYKHRPDEEKPHQKNASRHGHAKYKQDRDIKKIDFKKLEKLIGTLDDDLDDITTIP